MITVLITVTIKNAALQDILAPIRNHGDISPLLLSR